MLRPVRRARQKATQVLLCSWILENFNYWRKFLILVYRSITDLRPWQQFFKIGMSSHSRVFLSNMSMGVISPLSGPALFGYRNAL